MKITPLHPPRKYKVGRKNIEMSDCGKIELAVDEQVSFVTPSGSEYDVTKKSWGYYSTPSLNKRLVDHGLRAALAKNTEDRYFILLVEKSSESEFHSYLKSEDMELVTWMDTTETLQKISANKNSNCLFCGSTNFTPVFHYDAPPKGEILFQASQGSTYLRKVVRCQNCSHHFSVHNMDLSHLYSADYVNSTYKDSAGIARTFKKITSLDPSQSDNVGRVKHVLEFIKSFLPNEKIEALDVGSGIGVFPYVLQKEGQNILCTALDPDPRAAEHLSKDLGLKTICGDFMKSHELGLYDFISFNKVLEHVEDPIAMLSKAAQHLKPNGVVYIEVPDAEKSSLDGKDREEFFIDHWHIFSFASLGLLAQKSGLVPKTIERLKEPSTKYTLRGFFQK